MYKEIFDIIKKMDIDNSQKEKIISDVVCNFNLFIDYINQVVEYELFSESIIKWDSFAEYQFKKFENERQDKHDLCIMACHNLNKICNEIGLGNYTEIDLNDRHAVAELVGSTINEIYASSISKQHSLDDFISSLVSKETQLPQLNCDDFIL